MDKSEFLRLKSEWKEETAHISSPIERSAHPAYQRIIGGGEESLRFIIEDLRQNGPDHWFWALKSITGADPVSEENLGRMEAMTEEWLDWYDAQGYEQ